MSNTLTQERLKEVLHYDPETGVFTWRVKACNRWPQVGRVAGTPDGKGYLMVAIDRTRYKLHRLAFLYMTGSMPPHQVDHISGLVDDNRWVNLRLASQAENMQNRRVRLDNSSGHPGVNWSKSAKKFVARVSFSGVRKVLGYYETPEEAGAAYLEAKAQLHGFNPTVRAT